MSPKTLLALIAMFKFTGDFDRDRGYLNSLPLHDLEDANLRKEFFNLINQVINKWEVILEQFEGSIGAWLIYFHSENLTQSEVTLNLLSDHDWVRLGTEVKLRDTEKENKKKDIDI